MDLGCFSQHRRLALIMQALIYCSAATCCASAASVAPFLQPTGFGIAATAPSNGIFPVSSATSPQANWMVDQWGNPDTLLPAFIFKQGSSGLTSWTAANSRGMVQELHAPTGLFLSTLQQDGSTLYCGPNSSSPLEYDLFLAPNSHAFNPTYPSATLTDKSSATNFALGTMKSLTVKGSVRMARSWTPTVASHCVVNQGSLVYAIILKNTVVSPSQILYYQLNLTALQCAPGTDPARYSWCQSYRPGLTYFQAASVLNSAGQVSHTQFGADDPLTSYNLPLLQTSSVPTSLDFDMLPRLRAVIQAGSPVVSGVAAMDTNFANWRISSIYYGQHIWGGIGIESVWAGMLPVATY